MLTPNTKLYVQLRPDASGIKKLQQAQNNLQLKDAVLVRLDSLHLTIIHIGQLDRTISAIKAVTTISEDQVLLLATDLSSRLIGLVNDVRYQHFELNAVGTGRFGESQKTYVLEFENNARLTELYAACLRELKMFFSECGIADVQSFMMNDFNYRYALSIKPHIALAKSYSGTDIQFDPQKIKFEMMPIVY